MSSRQTEDQLQLLLRMEMVRDVFDVDNVGGTGGVDNGVDGGEYDHVDGDSDQTFHMISVSSNVTPLQVTCSNS